MSILCVPSILLSGFFGVLLVAAWAGEYRDGMWDTGPIGLALLVAAMQAIYATWIVWRTTPTQRQRGVLFALSVAALATAMVVIFGIEVSYAPTIRLAVCASLLLATGLGFVIALVSPPFGPNVAHGRE